MIFCGSYEQERIIVHPMDALNESHYLTITKGKDTPTFSVTCCCDDEWFWEFWYTKSDYERIKFVIMKTIFECETMDELMDELDEVFWDGFEDILVEYEYECNGDCANCDME